MNKKLKILLITFIDNLITLVYSTNIIRAVSFPGEILGKDVVSLTPCLHRLRGESATNAI